MLLDSDAGGKSFDQICWRAKILVWPNYQKDKGPKWDSAIHSKLNGREDRVPSLQKMEAVVSSSAYTAPSGKQNGSKRFQNRCLISVSDGHRNFTAIASNMNDVLTFHCEFGEGTSCTHILDLEQYRRDPKNIRPKTIWKGSRTKEMFPKYEAWIHSVNQRISERIQSDHVHVLQTWFETPHWQFWVYHTVGSRELIVEGDGKFDPSLIGRNPLR